MQELLTVTGNGTGNGSSTPPGQPSSHSNDDDVFRSVVYNFTHKSAVQLGCILSATDTVAVLSLLDKQLVPTLYSTLFGEGVVNDAMSIVLYAAIGSVDFGRLNESTLYLDLLTQFMLCLLESSLIGALFGLSCSALL